MSDFNETEAALKAGKTLAGIQMAGKNPVMLVPNDCQVKDLEPYLERPLMAKISVEFHDSESFVAYVNEHKHPNTRIFAAGTRGEQGVLVEAVLDFHQREAPSWNHNRATLPTAFSPEWQKWTASHNQPKNQRDFAFFIEDSIEHFVEPKGLAMMDLARGLEGTITANFTQASRLDNGDHSFAYTVQTVARAGEKKDLEVPNKFLIEIPVFHGEAAQKVQCRLRYSLEGGKVTWRYEIVNKRDILDNAVASLLANIEKETKIKPFLGSI